MSGSIPDMIAESIVGAFRRLMLILIIGWIVAIALGSVVLWLIFK